MAAMSAVAQTASGVPVKIPRHYSLSHIPNYESMVTPYGIRVQRPYFSGLPVVRAELVAHCTRYVLVFASLWHLFKTEVLFFSIHTTLNVRMVHRMRESSLSTKHFHMYALYIVNLGLRYKLTTHIISGYRQRYRAC